MGIDLISHGYNEAKTAVPGEFVKLPPGGYVCKIVNAEIAYSKAGKPMLILYLEIFEGEFKGYFADATKRTKAFNPNRRWDSGGIFRQNIFNKDDNISPFFKYLFMTFIRENPNVKVSFDNFEADCFQDKLLGFVFAEEEYEYEGRKSVRVVPKIPKLVEDILSGNFKVPELKRKPAQDTSYKKAADEFGGEKIPDDDSPF